MDAVYNAAGDYLSSHAYGLFNPGSEVFVPRLVWLSMSRAVGKKNRHRKKATMVVLGNLNHVEMSEASRLRVPLPLVSPPVRRAPDRTRYGGRPAGRVEGVQEGGDDETARLQCASFGVMLVWPCRREEKK